MSKKTTIDGGHVMAALDRLHLEARMHCESRTPMRRYMYGMHDKTLRKLREFLWFSTAFLPDDADHPDRSAYDGVPIQPNFLYPEDLIVIYALEEKYSFLPTWIPVAFYRLKGDKDEA